MPALIVNQVNIKKCLWHSFLFTLWCVVLITSCKSQEVVVANDSSYIPDQEYFLMTDIVHLSIDKLKNLYVVDNNFRLRKYNSEFVFQYEYSNRNLGDIGTIDATNPLHILVYYPEFQIVKVLDVTLAETHSYDLTDLNFTDVQAVGSSNDNGIWLYDETMAKLKKLNSRGELIGSSERLDLLIKDGLISPDQIYERDNRVYVYDPEYGLLIFDNLTQLDFVHTPMKGGSIQAYGKFIIHTEGGNATVWDPLYRFSEAQPLKLKYLGADQILYAVDVVFLRYDTDVYRIPSNP